MKPFIDMPKGVKLEEVVFPISHESDCCAPADADICNDMTIETPSGGGGKYLTIEAKRWAFSDAKDIDDFATMLKDILAKVE